MVPLPIRCANREETWAAHNPPIASIRRTTNPLISRAFPKIQRPQPPALRPGPIIPPFRRREGRKALRSCRGGNGMSGRGVSARRSGFADGPSGSNRRPRHPGESRDARRALGPPGIKGDGQGTRAVPGIGFARLRPARRRLRRQGVKSAAGPEDIQADSSRSDISCGATSRSRNTISPRSPGFAPGAPPALPAPPGDRRR